MECRGGCGACCIAPSINSLIPGMPQGKAAGVRCIQLSPDNKCLLFGDPRRPAFCTGLKPSREMCGLTKADAHSFLNDLEVQTKP